ncbi:MAG TPA: protease complex subunit PrcB family protein [Firmicutes bacterium]|nr:protease complex subunit PrcB family protein [Bacillota bacterium]
MSRVKRLRFTRLPEAGVIDESRQPVFRVLDGRPELLPPHLPPAEALMVAVHRGYCPSGGYSVRVQEVLDKHDVVEVRVLLRDPDPQEFVTTVVTEPKDVIVLDKRQLQKRGKRLFRFVDQNGRELSRQETVLD